MNEQERQDALREAIRGAVASEAERAELATTRAVPKPSGSRQGLLLVTWLVIAWLVVARPDFLFRPGAPPPPSPARAEAALRYGMYLAYHQARAFERDHGRAPIGLEELALVPPAGVRLEATNGAWRLVGDDGTHHLILERRMSADSFLGESLTLLRGTTDQ